MTRSIRKNLLTVAVASTALLASAHSWAGLINHEFTVTIDTTTSPLFNQSFTGSFSYDDTQVPAPGFGGEDLYTLQHFAFEFAGNVYGLADLFYGDVALMAGELLGLDAGAPHFAFLPASVPFPAAFAYDFGTGDAGNGSVVFTRAGEVPEPTAALLLGSALLAFGALRAQRKA